MSIQTALRMDLTTSERLDANTGGLAANAQPVRYSGYDFDKTLNATSSPAATKSAFFLLTLTAGAATINLAALTGTNGATVDGTGLKVRAFRFRPLGANGMTVVPGASNGIDLFGAASSVTVPTGGCLLQYFANGSPTVASGDRTLDVTGTGTETAEVSIILG